MCEYVSKDTIYWDVLQIKPDSYQGISMSCVKNVDYLSCFLCVYSSDTSLQKV